MGIGAGILIVAVGAVLSFAVKVTDTHGFNVHTVGIILMVAGVAGVVLDLLLFMPRRRRVPTVAQSAQPVAYDNNGTVAQRRDDVV
jgi:hypothetical protein